jgi:energy-coupling factor transporter ATP-binding protein EcfA2
MTCSTIAPFPGLQPFGVDDAPWFFGRAAQVAALARQLRRRRFLAVVGGSGVGKSSLVYAGLLPRLQQEPAVDGARWRVIELKPRGTPRDALATAFLSFLNREGLVASVDLTSGALLDHVRATLSRSSMGLVDLAREWLPGNEARLLILVDQFEELFRYAPPQDAAASGLEDEPAAFVALLLAATSATDSPFTIMLTMRSDYIGDCIRFEGLPEAISEGLFLVPRLVREQVEEAVVLPVRNARAVIDHDLVQKLVNDNARELDALPVLQHALMRIWDRARERRTERRLTLAHYAEVGGWRDTLSRHADQVLAELAAKPDGADLEMAAEQVFRALTEVDRLGRAVRRPLPFRQLVEEVGFSRARVRNVIDVMRAEHRSFLRPPKGTPIEDNTIIDIGHEALIRCWRKLQDPDLPNRHGRPSGWLRKEEQDGQRYRSLLDFAEMGRHTGEPALLPPGQALVQWEWWSERKRTEAWAARYGGELPTVLDLLERSVPRSAERLARPSSEYEREEDQGPVISATPATPGVEISDRLPPEPYPGPRPFQPEEWAIFIGRESMTDDVLARLAIRRLVVVHGAPGCGKSSLVRAGVLPSLYLAHARGGEAWKTAIARPSGGPLRNIAQALAEALGPLPVAPVGDAAAGWYDLLTLGTAALSEIERVLAARGGPISAF